MDKAAIKAARSSLEKASEAIERLKKIKSFDEFEPAWQDFLVSSNRVFTKLEQGSKVSGHSSAWFANRKRERKDDELLSYLHHARNVDEHTISPVHEVKEGSMGIGTHGRTHIKRLEIDNGRITHADISGDPLRITIGPPTIALLPVKDRGIIYNPPKQHAGMRLVSIHPIDIATIAISYLNTLVGDAENL
jgi:hypothetical protein